MVLCYGGFPESTIAIFGMLVAGVFLGRKIKVRITHSKGIFLIFSLWYFLCSVVNGFVLEYAIRGLIPLLACLFWIWCSDLGSTKEKIKDVIVEVSLWIAVASIIHCVIISVNAESLRRITFPFDYSNASGIYFAACYFMAQKSRDGFLNKCKYIFVLALLLTQSVGAIGLFALVFLYQLIKDKKYWYTLGIIFGIILGGFCFKERIIESSGTFIERLLQIYDGTICMTKNPVFGIGAGWWEHAKDHYQTGFYLAKTIHSSIITIGVNSGVIGLILFLSVCFLEIRKMAVKKNISIPAVLILTHCFLDFTLSFMALDVLLVLSLPDCDDEKAVEVNEIPRKIIAGILMISFILFTYGIIRVNAFQKNVRTGASESISEIKKDFYIRNSIRCVQYSAAQMYQEETASAELNEISYKYMPIELLLYKSKCEGGEEYLLKSLEKQPYNTVLRDFIVSDYQGEVSEKASLILETAATKASFFGKILYNIKGENI